MKYCGFINQWDYRPKQTLDEEMNVTVTWMHDRALGERLGPKKVPNTSTDCCSMEEGSRAKRRVIRKE